MEIRVSKGGNFKGRCEICDNLMIGYKSEVEGRRFCSNICKGVWQSSNPERHPPRKQATTKIEKPCEICGNIFTSWKANNRKFCSNLCRGKALVIAHTGIKSGKWKAIDRQSTSVRSLAKRYFPKSCAVCGWNIASCDSHHIISAKEGGKNILKNMIILCPNHHRMADEGIFTQDELLDAWHKSYDSLNLDSTVIN